MEIVLKAAFERDVDLVLVRAFSENNRVAQLFLNSGDKILEVHHSAMELHGESDLLIIVERKGQRHAILIEDKIDAPAQPDQYIRYCERGKSGQNAGRWVNYTIYIAAPQKYLENDREAGKYPNKVSYEAIHLALANENDPLSLAVIEAALCKSEGTLPTVVDEAVTAFWENYYNYHKQHAPHLLLHVNRGKKGPNATWPSFRTVLRDTKILHKSEQGYVDLQFRGLAGKYLKLKQLINPYLAEDMLVSVAGDSAVVRIVIPIMDFSKPFDIYEEEIATVFSVVTRLNNLAEVIQSKNLQHLL